MSTLLVRRKTAIQVTAASWRTSTKLRAAGRYGIALVALAINVYSALQLRGDYYSAMGGIGWVVSLIILFCAFLGYRTKAGS